ncbi:MAG TPA: TonB-dependent receptor [Rhizomicrobium sp.]|nr:TonB-dependent receptor [Rhizomicrobium sp.]
MRNLKFALAGLACAICASAPAFSEAFNIPAGDLATALNAYTKQTGVALIISGEEVRGSRTAGVKGDYSAENALSKLLTGTGFIEHHRATGAIGIVRANSAEGDVQPSLQLAAAPAPAASNAALETVTVTSSKLGGDVQNIPISITALSQEQLTATQTVGGPDLVKQVPNFNFSKTNFTGYNIQIRGIGTQAISVTTDPAVAVAFNDTPFLRNHFFEQEFYDVSQVEILRGPQGTLYGRNATAGVVNLVSAKPTDQFEAMASADVGNYQERRLEGMINVPITDDRLDLRIAGEWTKRQGYTFDETTGERVDGRDLWSTRTTIGMKPFDHVQAYLVWEHFSEDDDRERSTKQLCNFDPGPASVGPLNQSFTANEGSDPTFTEGQNVPTDRSARAVLSQGCLPASLYAPQSYETPNGGAIPIIYAAELGGAGVLGGALITGADPYSSDRQSMNLRVIQSELKPVYKAKNDTVELNTTYTVTPALTVTSETGFNHDFLGSEEDFNRFNSNPGLFFTSTDEPNPDGYGDGHTGVKFTPGGVFCDPQLGCSTKLVGEDLSQEHAWQLSQELRLSSNFSGPFNFSVGGNYLHYETLEDYYVFLNVLSLEARFQDLPRAPNEYFENGLCEGLPEPQVFPTSMSGIPIGNCPYTDGTPLAPGFDGQGHNYFRSENPYLLNSYAGFGEANYQVLDDVKITGGLRWTDDQKHFVEIPSELLIKGWGYPIAGTVNQQWDEWTGRAVVNWTPKLDFTDQTLVYASFSRGYKAGGANPPPPNFFSAAGGAGSITHPLTFAPEFVNAYEGGTKNTLLDGALTLNSDVFYYDYKGYQISQIVDRTSINLNFNANVRGAEIETTYEPIPGLRFNFAGGWEDTKLASGSKAIDLMDRTAGHAGWIVVKPSPVATSNCILPTYVIAELLAAGIADAGSSSSGTSFIGEGEYISSLQFQACQDAYQSHFDPTTDPFIVSSIIPPSGFDPSTAPNNGEGFDKNLTGNQLPNAPPFTVSFGAQYTMPITADWAGTLRGDYYWQDYSWARVFNDNPYDRLRGYTNINLTLIFTNQDGWQVMLYDKNVFDTTAITGAFLNSDDSALTTNVFVTDPKLIGIRVTKNW